MNSVKPDEQSMPSEVIEIFESHRPKLIGLAYRITGSSFEAEDIAQECFIKWLAADHATITSPDAWLVTVATRIALDHLKSARLQRETYVGQWLPEPFIDSEKGPEDEHELDESITIALLVLLEQLTPGERAVYILHDLFHYNFDEISAILEKTAPACRKLASRARQKINQVSTSPKADKQEHLQIVSAFYNAVKNGELQTLTRLLRDNIMLTADGGGKAAAAREVLQGLDTVAEFLLRVVSPNFTGKNLTSISKTVNWFNGTPGFVIWSNHEPVSAFNFEIEHHQIKRINVLRNPDKLRFFKSG